MFSPCWIPTYACVQEFSNRYHRHSHPLDYSYQISPVKVLQAEGGVVQYIYGTPFLANSASTIVLGLTQAARGVHVSQDMTLSPVSSGKPPSTVLQLLQAFKRHLELGRQQGLEEGELEEAFSKRFQEAFRPHFTTFFRKGALHFYAPAVAAGSMNEVQLTPAGRPCSTSSAQPKRVSTRIQGRAQTGPRTGGQCSGSAEGQRLPQPVVEAEDGPQYTEFYTRWATFIANRVPLAMHPASPNNICRVLGRLPGVTQVYAYLGGGSPLFRFAL
jgi:hypothetical protein